MIAALVSLITWAFSSAIAMLLVGGGITVVVATGLNATLNTFLTYITTSALGLPIDILNLSLLSGWGEAISIVGSAMLTRITLTMASNIIGLKKI